MSDNEQPMSPPRIVIVTTAQGYEVIADRQIRVLHATRLDESSDALRYSPNWPTVSADAVSNHWLRHVDYLASDEGKTGLRRRVALKHVAIAKLLVALQEMKLAMMLWPEDKVPCTALAGYVLVAVDGLPTLFTADAERTGELKVETLLRAQDMADIVEWGLTTDEIVKRKEDIEAWLRMPNGYRPSAQNMQEIVSAANRGNQ